MVEREYMTQEEIEATFQPIKSNCPTCGELLYFDTVKETNVCLTCNYEAKAKIMPAKIASEEYRIAEYNGKWFIFHSDNWVSAVRLSRTEESKYLDKVLATTIKQGIHNELPYMLSKSF